MFPRRYYVDTHGHRVLIGFTVEETIEFETLDETPPVDDHRDVTRETVTDREMRWLELYTKHANAWMQWNMGDSDSP